ncbi:MAG: hypothetical protein CM15mP121_1140 [Bacteroidota bacterium]|nr:MAG: hypothetical protein CM15mP121_1140 [Bacteroidota bacterium]
MADVNRKIIQYRLVFKLNKESSLKSKAEIEKVLALEKSFEQILVSLFLNSQNSSELPKKVCCLLEKNSCPCC